MPKVASFAPHSEYISTIALELSYLSYLTFSSASVGDLGIGGGNIPGTPMYRADFNLPEALFKEQHPIATTHCQRELEEKWPKTLIPGKSKNGAQ
jgi:hypothetical protein